VDNNADFIPWPLNTNLLQVPEEGGAEGIKINTMFK